MSIGWRDEAACAELNKFFKHVRDFLEVGELHGAFAKVHEIFEAAFALVQDFDGEEVEARMIGFGKHPEEELEAVGLGLGGEDAAVD